MTIPGDVGYTTPFDDDSDLTGEVSFYRAVHPSFFDWNSYDEGGLRPVRGQAFTAMSETQALDRGYQGRAMSVAHSGLLAEHYANDLDAALDAFLLKAEKVGWGVAQLEASDIRQVDPPLGLCLDSIEAQPWHALVFPVDKPNINKRVQGQLADFCKVIRAPDR